MKISKKVKIFGIVLGLFGLAGCSTTSSSPSLDLQKEIIVLEHDIRNAESESSVSSSLPLWVLNPESVFDVAYGVGCEVYPGADFNKQQKVKSIALDKARLGLFRLTTGSQELYAEETVNKKDGKSKYNAQIYSKSYGSIGRNEINRDGVYSDNGLMHYCVAVTLVY